MDSLPLENSLVLVKPDGVFLGHIGDVISRLEQAGLRVVASKMVWITEELAGRHYFDLEKRRGKQIFNAAVEYLSMGPSMALVVQGTSARARVKQLVGATDPAESAPGTIRADLSMINRTDALEAGIPLFNVVHCSSPDDPSEAAHELGLYFNASELLEPYPIGADAFARLLR
jgi:nucleoside-diphosphate kinase